MKKVNLPHSSAVLDSYLEVVRRSCKIDHDKKKVYIPMAQKANLAILIKESPRLFVAAELVAAAAAVAAPALLVETITGTGD